MSPIADTVVLSTSNADMVDAPFFMQAATGDTPIEYTATDYRRLLDAIWLTEGVMSGEHLKVTQRASGANFSVDVQLGIGLIQGDTVTNQGKYLVVSNGVVNLTTPNAPASGARSHRVIARIRDKLNDGSQTSYTWSLELLEDIGSGQPGLPNSAISLATVTIASGQSNVSNSNITELRTYARVNADSYLTRGIIGGRRITGTNPLGSGITTTEVNPTHMNSGEVSLLGNRVYRIHARYKGFSTVTGSEWLMRIRQAASAGITGTQIRQWVHTQDDGGQGYTREVFAEYITGTSSETRNFSLTCVRLSATGSFQFIGGDSGAINVLGLMVEDMGPNTMVTTAS